MKKWRKQLFVMVAVTVLMTVAIASPAFAGYRDDLHWGDTSTQGLPISQLKKNMVVYGKSYRTYVFGPSSINENAEFVAEDSSNWKVAWPATDEEFSGYISLECKKPGKATVSYTYGRFGDYEGLKYTGDIILKKRISSITVKKMVNPFKKILIGGKNYKSKFNKKQYYYNLKLNNKKLRITPKAGWKIKSIKARYWNGSTIAFKKMKNGGVIPKKATSVFIVMQKKSDGGLEEIEIGDTSSGFYDTKAHGDIELG